MHPHYTRRNFPHFVCQYGNWNIYADDIGRCAAIPTDEFAALGCRASTFGNLEYVRRALSDRAQHGGDDGRV